MKYILIDTNCWIDLLHEESEINLGTLEHWVILAKAVLLIPEQLSKEWERQKQIKFKLITKAQTEALPKLKTFKQLVKIEHNYIQERMDRIDKLFVRGKHFKPNKVIQSEVTKRFI
jgi:predicted nucleic acid-binding protein